MAMFTVYPAPQLRKILRDMEVEYSADATPVDLAYQVERSINEKQMVHPLIEQRVHIATITMKMAFEKTPEGKLNIDLAGLETLRKLALEVNLFDWQLVGQLLTQQGHHPTSHQFDELWEEFNQAVSDPVEEYRQEVKRLVQHRLLRSIQTVQALDRQMSELTVDPTEGEAEESTD